MEFLELKNIQKSYYLGKSEFPVLKGINLNFELGDFVSILGESGGGKSTLMNIIGGLDRNFTGQVLINGQKLDHKQNKHLDEYRRKTVGYIYQNYNLIPHLTVLDNVALGLEMTKLDNKAKKRRALELLNQVGLKDHVKKYPKQLSGGQKQRVAIARALATDPKIIIADEPTGALDSKNTEEVLQLLTKIAQAGRLVITVTHSEHVAKAGTRIVRLADGKITNDQRIKPAYPVKKLEMLQSKPLGIWSSVKAAYKHFKYHFKRNFLIMLGTAIGLFSVILFNGLGVGVKAYVTDQVNSLVNPREIIVNPYAKASNETQKQQQMMQTMLSGNNQISFNQADVTRISRLKHVEKVEKNYIISSVNLKYQKKQSLVQRMSAISDLISTGSVKVGRMPKNGEVILDKNTAKELAKKAKYLLGKKVKLTYFDQASQRKLTLNLKVVGLTDGGNTPVNIIGGTTLQKELKKQKIKLKINSLGVKVTSMKLAKKVASQIEKIKVNNKKRYNASAVSGMLSTIEVYINLVTKVLAGIAAISLLVSALMIIVTMSMSVADRTKEIGILRALGESKRDIRRLFTSEALIIGLASATLASLMAFSAQIAFNSLLSKITKFAFIQISLTNIISCFVISVIIALIAAILPARHAANLNPIEALAGE